MARSRKARRRVKAAKIAARRGVGDCAPATAGEDVAEADAIEALERESGEDDSLECAPEFSPESLPELALDALAEPVSAPVLELSPDQEDALGVASWPEPSEEPELEVLSLFNAAEGDDMPFDPPDESDFAAAAEEPSPAAAEIEQITAEPQAPPAPPGVQQEAAPPPRVRKPAAPEDTIPRPRVVVAPSSRAYLAAVRVATLEQARRVKRNLPRAGFAQSVTLGLSLPLLLAGVWALTEPPNSAAMPELMPAAAAAAPPSVPPPPQAPQLDAQERQADYDSALRQIEAGGTQAGIALLRRAAENGHPEAQYKISKLFEKGDGVTRNLTQALRWAQRAAMAGNCRAMHDVGVYFAQGEGAPRDEVAAFRWFRQAAEFGVADSQFNLGLLYQQGRGVAADAPEALFWFLVAAHNRDINAADHAAEVAAGLSREQIAQTRARAWAFEARTPDSAANGGAPA
jgi:TPR repeat protein